MPRQNLARAALCCAAISLGLASASGAWGQVGRSSGDDRQSGSRTVIGAPNAQTCGRAVAVSDLSERAMAACDRAISSERLNRTNLIATRINRGTLHLRRGEGEAAVADFDAVIAFEPQNAEAYLNRGGALIQIGRPGPAVASITEALSLGVREPHKAYYNRAAAREALGDLRGAYEDYSTALEIEPDWGPANAEIARFARNRQQHLAGVLAEEGSLPSGPN